AFLLRQHPSDDAVEVVVGRIAPEVAAGAVGTNGRAGDGIAQLPLQPLQVNLGVVRGDVGGDGPLDRLVAAVETGTIADLAHGIVKSRAAWEIQAAARSRRRSSCAGTAPAAGPR